MIIRSSIFDNVKCKRVRIMCTGIRTCEYFANNIRFFNYISINIDD